MHTTVKPPARAEMIKELVGSSFASRFADLAATLETSSLAVALVEESGNDLPRDLVVAAWTQHGNALRLAGRYAEAETTLARAGALPSSDLPTRIHLLGVQSSLYRNTGRFMVAETLLAKAIEAQKPLRDPAGKARLHNLLGLVYHDRGRPSEALCSFRDALTLLGPDSPPDLLLSTGHNLFETLIVADRLEEASAVQAILEPSYRHLTGSRIAAKAEWTRARLCRALGQLSAARFAYGRAYEHLSREPRSPELAQLATEMEDLISASPRGRVCDGRGGLGR